MENTNLNEDIAPGFLSIEFHTRFFPVLLRNRIRRNERIGTGFSSVLELKVLFVVCFFLITVGLHYAMVRKLPIGWAPGGLGAAGMLFLLIHSICSRGTQPSYDRFLTGVFFFFVALGLSGGIFAGTLYHSLAVGVATGAAGLLVGYSLGILTGLFLQYFGWLAPMVSGIAGLAAFGLFFADLVLMAGRLF
ncbi:MAG: hypothetical protein ABSF90_15035 [Syntrophobacteraceae bacterium]|jgi:hypothetical protein